MTSSEKLTAEVLRALDAIADRPFFTAEEFFAAVFFAVVPFDPDPKLFTSTEEDPRSARTIARAEVHVEGTEGPLALSRFIVDEWDVRGPKKPEPVPAWKKSLAL